MQTIRLKFEAAFFGRAMKKLIAFVCSFDYNKKEDSEEEGGGMDVPKGPK